MNRYTKTSLCSLIFVCALLIGSTINAQETEPVEKSFDETLSEHLDAVINHKLQNYIGSLSKENISMILPNGKLMATIEDIKTMHQEWFAESGWTFEYKIIRKSETEEMAYALLDVDYYNLDEQNTRDYRPFFLVVVFEKENGEWKLTHDQCTPNISKKIAAESDPASQSVPETVSDPSR